MVRATSPVFSGEMFYFEQAGKGNGIECGDFSTFFVSGTFEQRSPDAGGVLWSSSSQTR